MALIVSALKPSQLQTISSASDIQKLMAASASGKGISSVARKTLGKGLLSGAGGASKVSSLGTDTLNSTAELFIEQT